MPSRSFDPAKAVTFDLPRGQIRDGGSGTRLLVPAPALLALCASATPEAIAAFARDIGDAIGSTVARRFEALGMAVGSASVDEVTEHLGGELAVAGFGMLTVERWGRALVLVVDHGPAHADADRILSPLLAAAVTRATGKEAESVRLGREGQRARFLVTSRAASKKVGEWLRAGVSWGDALVRLHAGSAQAETA